MKILFKPQLFTRKFTWYVKLIIDIRRELINTLGNMPSLGGKSLLTGGLYRDAIRL